MGSEHPQAPLASVPLRADGHAVRAVATDHESNPEGSRKDEVGDDCLPPSRAHFCRLSRRRISLRARFEVIPATASILMPSRDRSLRCSCGTYGAYFIACYDTEKDAGTKVKDVDKCGLCGGDPFKRDNLKDAVLRLIPDVRARNVKCSRPISVPIFTVQDVAALFLTSASQLNVNHDNSLRMSPYSLHSGYSSRRCFR